jgi:hypothetical protein
MCYLLRLSLFLHPDLSALVDKKSAIQVCPLAHSGRFVLQILRELESRLKGPDDDVVVVTRAAAKLPEAAQVSKRGRLVAPRLAFWQNEYYDRDQVGEALTTVPSLFIIYSSKACLWAFGMFRAGGG